MALLPSLLAEDPLEVTETVDAREERISPSGRVYEFASADRSDLVGRDLVVLMSRVTRISRSRLTRLSSSSRRWICFKSFLNWSRLLTYAAQPGDW